MRLINAIYEVLAAAAEPLHIEEMTRRLLDSGLWQTTSKTPQQSVGAAIYADIKHHADETRFEQVTRRVFRVRPSAMPVAAVQPVTPQPVAAVQPVTPQPVAAVQPVTPQPELVALDLFTLIDLAGHDAAAARAEYSDRPEPELLPETDYAAVLDEYLIAQYIDEAAVLAAPSSAAADASVADAAALLTVQNARIQRQIVARLLTMPVEHLIRVVERLLRAVGFAPAAAVTITPGGDVLLQTQALLVGLLPVTVTVAVSRKLDRTADALRALRTQLADGAQGLLLIPGPIDDATRAAATGPLPITLLDGPALADLCLRHAIGTRAEQLLRYEIDEAQFQPPLLPDL